MQQGNQNPEFRIQNVFPDEFFRILDSSDSSHSCP